MSYTYDANGNMLSNSNNAITNQNKSFTYNLLNLPLVATIATGTATYTYDATGTKLRKVDVLNGVTKTTDYISGIEYDNSTTTIGFIQTEEGKAAPGTGGFDYTYYLGDNLGNTRVTFDTQTGVAAVLQQDDYYPFGLEINHIVSSPKNEYLYNKKELQEELGQYDYGARFYDPVIGRWTSVDPMVEAGQESTTPYGYVFDDPISHTDPDGKVPCCDLEISILEAGFTAAGEVEGGSLGSGTPIAGGIIIGTIGAVASVYIGEHLPSYSGSISTAHSGGVPVMQRDRNLQPVPVQKPAIVQSNSNQKNLGSIYKVPGHATKSGKPYIGRHNKPNPQKTRRSNDGRDRKQAEVIDTYDAGNPAEGRNKEQKAIDDNGGVENLDNVRNEVKKDPSSNPDPPKTDPPKTDPPTNGN